MALFWWKYQTFGFLRDCLSHSVSRKLAAPGVRGRPYSGDGVTATMEIVIAGPALAFLFACAATFVRARALFAEPVARKVPSIAGSLGARRVLAVLAHPDDELRVAALLRTAKRRDHASTALVTATRGEMGGQVPLVARQRDLAAVRTAELLKSGFALRIDEQEIWDFPDGALADVDFERLSGRVEEAIRRHRPELLVTFWPASGQSGHPDHMRIGLAAEAAALRLAKGAAIEGYGGPRWIAYVLAPRRGIRAIGGEAGAFVAARQPAPTHMMPGRLSTRMKGWRIHASQRYSIETSYRIPARLLYLVWRNEFYKVSDLKDHS